MKLSERANDLLFVGVSGHRDLRPQDVATLEHRVRDLFDRLQQSFPDASLVALSPLAEGADRLFARVALDRGLRLIAPLPLPRDLYEKDFATAESRAEFTELFSKADTSCELPLAPGVAYDEVVDYGPDRDMQYALVGAFIAQHTDVLVALWDGIPIEKEGGTSHIIRFRMEGIPAKYAACDLIRSGAGVGPIYHIFTPRLSKQEELGEPGTAKWLLPGVPQANITDAEALQQVRQRQAAANHGWFRKLMATPRDR